MGAVRKDAIGARHVTLPDLWKQLGRAANRTVVFDEHAPLAAIPRALLETPRESFQPRERKRLTDGNCERQP